MEIKERKDIEEKYLWDLSSMFESDEAFEKALDDAKAYLPRIAEFEGEISKSSEKLLEFLQLDDEIGILLGRIMNYAQRKCDEDTRIAKYQDYSAKAMTFAVSLQSACAWFTPEILSLTDEQIEAFYKECPELELYRRSLETVFAQRGHTLSAKEEQLLAAAGEMASAAENIYSMFGDADLAFEDATDSEGNTHSVTHGSYGPLMMSADRELRRSAYESMYKSCRQFRNTTAATLSAQVKSLKFYADARKYNSTLEAALSATEVPTEVYTNLIEAVHSGMEPMYKYVKLRKKMLGVDELHFYDIYAPMVSDVDMHFTYEEACDIIIKALEPMGEEYLNIVKEGLNSRWIDVYENKGKRSGAYSAGGYGMNPNILLNFHGTLSDVFTLIHEMGHSLHTYLSSHTQPPVYSNYVIFVAEVASTCNEALLMQYLLKTTEDKKQKAYILNHFLEQFKSTLYRQTMFAEFELKVNQLNEAGEGVTADACTEIYRDLQKLYFGDDIVIDDNIAHEWTRIPHFYYNYYVYQYSTGFAAAMALSQRILTMGEPAVKDYIGFLSGGCSKKPIDLLRGAGVDMASPQPVLDAIKVFEGLIDEFESLSE
ncbi:MAG: oligoendopeptidase F [Clostridia bacterium]|nr:oligoendopeptidase F [Clostridia bacterium]